MYVVVFNGLLGGLPGRAEILKDARKHAISTNIIAE